MFIVMSLDCTGLDRSLEYIRDVLEESKPHIMCLQETWHLSRNYSKLNNIHDDYILMTDINGVNCQEKILPGRPYGELAIIVRRSIADTISKVKIDSRRVCAVALNDNVDTKLTVINVYMPCDNNNAHEVNHA